MFLIVEFPNKGFVRFYENPFSERIVQDQQKNLVNQLSKPLIGKKVTFKFGGNLIKSSDLFKDKSEEEIELPYLYYKKN